MSKESNPTNRKGYEINWFMSFIFVLASFAIQNFFKMFRPLIRWIADLDDILKITEGFALLDFAISLFLVFSFAFIFSRFLYKERPSWFHILISFLIIPAIMLLVLSVMTDFVVQQPCIGTIDGRLGEPVASYRIPISGRAIDKEIPDGTLVHIIGSNGWDRDRFELRYLIRIQGDIPDKSNEYWILPQNVIIPETLECDKISPIPGTLWLTGP